VGFVGLGVMGAPMAGHLGAAGFLSAIYDIDARAASDFGARYPGAAVATSPAELARECDVVMTMVPDGHVVQDVVLGRGGAAEGLAEGALLVDASSSQPWLTKATAAALAERGVTMIDAPVSGAQWGAEAAELVFMVGGANDDVARARPLLETLGRAVFHLGPLGSGHTMKSINNTVTAATFEATLEGLALGVRAGLDPRRMNDVFNESTAGSWITRTNIDQRILSRTLDDPFRLSLMLKDIDTAVNVADQLDLYLPILAHCATIYRLADQAAGPGSSLSELSSWVERHAGVILESRSDV
jgi:3-hydroxyisobutyrate dehydrogenase-like beta-hydroxyacid dehydrogenase